MKPEELVLRCFGYKTKDQTWVLKCIDLSLVAEEETLKEAKKSLEDAIVTYVDAVLDTDKKETIPALLKRKSPVRDRLHYYGIALLIKIHSIRSRLIFEEAIPFHLHLPNKC